MLHAVAEVVAVTCTLKVPPLPAKVVGPQLRTCGAVPAIEQSRAFDWLSIDQVEGTEAGIKALSARHCIQSWHICEHTFVLPPQGQTKQEGSRSESRHS